MHPPTDDAMKNTGKCPKCGRSDPLRIPGGIGPYGTGNYIPAGETVFSHVALTRYLCRGCGYCEEWVETSGEIERIGRWWER